MAAGRPPRGGSRPGTTRGYCRDVRTGSASVHHRSDRRPRALRAIALAGVATLLLAACSMPRLAYNQADWLVLRELDSYLDLRDEQRERAAGVLEVHLSRHRREMLPGFARTFTEIAERTRRGLGDDDAHWIIEHSRALLAASAEDLLPDLAAVLADLDAKQRAHLRARLEERNREYREEHALDAPREERLEGAVARTVERIEFWTGPLSDEQLALVRELRSAMPDSAGAWLAYTEAQQQRLLALLDAGAPAADVDAFLRAWLLRQEGMPPLMAALREWRFAGLRAMLVRVTASLNSMQRERLLDRLEDLAEDASELATSA